MNSTVLSITNQGLALAFIPTFIAIGIMYRWRASANSALYGTFRMLIQLLLVGYVLIYIFETDNYLVILAVLLLMLLVASWIAIRPLSTRNFTAYRHSLLALSISGISTLGLVTQFVIDVDPWFSPRYVVPLAGMIFAAAMNAVSLAAERFQTEISRGTDIQEARQSALETSLIPIVNGLLAVGLVTLPGMMTGQVLSGVSPFVAAKYQIVVMAMWFGAAGMASAIYLTMTSLGSDHNN